MMLHYPRNPAALLASVTLCLGCSGDGGPATNTGPGGQDPSMMGEDPSGIGGAGSEVNPMGGTGPGEVIDPSLGNPASGSLRRVSPTQYQRVMRDLLGPLSSLPPIEDSPAGEALKSIGAAVTAVTPEGVELFEEGANAALTEVFADTARRDALVGCAPAAWDEACASSFVSTFGRKAWRRPLAADEVARYVALGAAEATDTGVFADGARAMASALLQSPNFTYRVELGSGIPLPGATYSRYTGFETATRLSFLLWGTTPDDQLLAAAESGALDTAEGIASEGQRLIASPRMADGLDDMVEDMLDLGAVYLMAKDEEVFPGLLTPTLRDAMRMELLHLFRDTAITRDANILELFTTQKTFVNQELGALYGIEVAGEGFVEAQHPAGIPRAGILSSAALLTVQDKRHETSPTRRGAYVRNVITCDVIPPPPDNVDTTIDPPPEGMPMTRKQLLAQHELMGAACQTCHAMMDPIGLAFENFDAMGRYRTNEENGLPIDPSGEIDGQSFAGPVELGAILSQSEKVRNCLVRRVYRYAMGRKENQYDMAQVQALSNAFATDGQRLSALLLNLVRNDGFLNVSAPEL